MIRPIARAVLVLAVTTAACAETGTAASQHPNDATMRSDPATARATPASMATASQTFGKGRAGEHKSMMHHH